jgi:hypothetical protein
MFPPYPFAANYYWPEEEEKGAAKGGEGRPRRPRQREKK